MSSLRQNMCGNMFGKNMCEVPKESCSEYGVYTDEGCSNREGDAADESRMFEIRPSRTEARSPSEDMASTRA
jgi:hypothetical protein